MGGVVVVIINQKISKIGFMRRFYRRNLLLWCDAIVLSFEHNPRAVSVIGANIGDLMPLRLHRANPNVSLNMLYKMTQMNVAIGVGQGTGY